MWRGWDLVEGAETRMSEVGRSETRLCWARAGVDSHFVIGAAYGPEAIDSRGTEMSTKTKTPKQIIDDMLARALKAPHGIVAEVHLINHDWAIEMRGRNTNNRKISKANVRRYRADAMNNRWTLNGQPIIFSSDGVLADGQHRGEAVVDSPFELPTLVVAGIPPEARVTMDQGRRRHAGDYLTMLGEETGDIGATMIRYIMAHAASDGSALRGLAKPSSAEILEYFAANRDRIVRSAEFAQAVRDAARYHVAGPMLAFLHYTLTAIDADAAQHYLMQIAKGEGLSETDPAYKVREKLIALGRIGATKKAEVILSGWKPFREGRPLKTIRVQGRLPDVS